MLKFFSRSSSVLAGAMLVAGSVALPLTSIAQSVVDPLVTPPVTPPVTATAPLLVIQGKVIAIRGTIVTVKTPNIQASPTLIIAGPAFSVDISKATFQSASGKLITPTPTLIIGDSIIVAGTKGETPVAAIPTPAGPNKLILAEVVAKIVP
ncbi:MAG: hypothetical protein ABI417_13675 [Coleofasciculaceae cyanobacterium]